MKTAPRMPEFVQCSNPGKAASFPDERDQKSIDAWKKSYCVRAIHCKVLAVAVTRIEGAWACYLAPVDGQNHDDEWFDVWQHGVKQPKDVADVLFPRYAHLPYAR
jgi:hypothetical protein